MVFAPSIKILTYLLRPLLELLLTLENKQQHPFHSAKYMHASPHAPLHKTQKNIYALPFELDLF